MNTYPDTKTKPWAHQVDAFKKAVDQDSFYLALDMGCGKSKVAVDLCNHHKDKLVLIICPKSVIPVWKKQFDLHSYTDYEIIAVTKKMTIKKKTAEIKKSLDLAALRGKPAAVVLNYEAFWRTPLGPTYDKHGRMLRTGLLGSYIWDKIILDEGHRIKSPGGRASWGAYRLAKKCKTKLILSGTPMPHALSADCPVLTPTGWKTISELKVNEYVIGSNGKPTKVIGVWPQGKKTLYSVTFSDDSNILCTAEHLWQVTSRGRRSRKLQPLIKRTDELNNSLPKTRINGNESLFDKNGAARWHIPIPEPIQFKVQAVPLDPYLLGALIGDGHFGSSIGFVTADKQIKDEISKVLPKGIKLIEHQGGSRGKAIDYRISSGKKGGSLKGFVRGPIKNPVTVAIESLGLQGHRSYEKFIPNCYLLNNIETRLSILQGLCDTDGSSYGSTTKYVTTSKKLADDIKFLVQSLGGYVKKISKEFPKEVTLPNGNKTISRTKYIIFFRMKLNPFRLKRKKDKFKPPWRKPRKSIIKIEEKKKANAVCITVEAEDGLYVAKNFIVTHNSPIDIYAQYRFLDNTVFGTNFNQFKQKYCIIGGYENKQVLGFRDIEDLHERFYSKAFRVLSRDVLDLPDTMHEIRTFDLDPKTMRIYKELEKEFITEVLKGNKIDKKMSVTNALVKMLRLTQMTAGIAKWDDGTETTIDNNKMNVVKDILEDLPEDEPVVIVGKFTPEIRAIKEVCKSLGRSCTELSGHKNQLEEWQNGKFDCIAVQVQAGKEGVDLTRAHYTIFSSTGCSLGDYEQILKRTDRPGQKHKGIYYHCLANDTYDVKIWNALKEKKKVVESVLSEIENGGNNSSMADMAIQDALKLFRAA